MTEPISLMRKRSWIMLVLAAVLAGCTRAAPLQANPTPTSTTILSPTASSSPTGTIPPTALPTTSGTPGLDQATFIRENYPDHSTVSPGETFVKTWEVKNIGTSTWNHSYYLSLASTPQNDSLGSPSRVPFPQDTPPGEIVPLSVSLTAPTIPGTYAVYWSLKNDRGETFGVDGGEVWVIIQVCAAGQPCTPPPSGGASSANGVTVTLGAVDSGAESTRVSFCMTLPNANYGPSGGSVSLMVDQKTTLASSGGSLTRGCFEFEFPISAAQIMRATHVSISIDNVRILGGANDADCEAARSKLKQQQPGIDFQCDLSSGLYYTHLQLPDGITQDQANTLIVDTIEGAIYGPWTLTVK